MRPRTLVALAVVATVGSASGTLLQKPAAVPQAKTVVVDAQQALDYRPIEGANVFIIGADGGDLAVGVTNKFGRAVLRYVDHSEHPRYVFVEKPGYFVTGLPYRPGLLEYWILLGGIAFR